MLDCTAVDVKRNRLPYQKYTSRQNSDSKLFVVSAQSSIIKSAGEIGQDCLDHIFALLYEEYASDISDAAGMIKACNSMLHEINGLCGRKLTSDDLDDFENINTAYEGQKTIPV